jgi:hypothetical protein
MPDELEGGTVRGLGFIEENGDLSAVVFFTSSPMFWRVDYLATDLRFRRRRRAIRLKRQLRSMARTGGAQALTSRVDETNVPMLSLNRKLNATLQPTGDGDIVCTLPVWE